MTNTPDDIIDLAAETMKGDLLNALLDEFKAARDVWPKLSQIDQEAIIFRFERRVGAGIREAVRMIAGDSRPVITAKLDQLTAKDGIKAVLSLSQHDANRHELLDAVGKVVLVVVADAEPYQGGDTPKAEPDQRPLLTATEALAAQDAAGGDEPPAALPEGADDADTGNGEALDALEQGLDAADLAEQRAEDAPDPDLADGPEPPPYVRDDGRLYDAILLIDEEWTGLGSDEDANLAQIASWSDAECEAVEAFCAVVYRQTNGDLSELLPIRPDCIGGPLPGQVADEAAPELPL